MPQTPPLQDAVPLLEVPPPTRRQSSVCLGRRKGASRPCGMGLRVPLPDVVAMRTRQPNLEGAGEIPLRRLVKEALRMRPSGIVVGEVRQEECLDQTHYG